MAYLDHVVIAVPDLDDAAARWHDVTGIAFAAGGRHPGGTGNCIGLLRGQEAYLELIALIDRTSADHWALLVRDRLGPVSWAIGSDDLDRDVAKLAQYGVPAGPVTDGSRRCPDGTTVTWRTSTVGEPGAGSWPFLIEWPVSGPGRLGVTAPPGDTRLSAVTVAVSDPAGIAAALTGVLGFSWCDGGRCDGGARVITDGQVTVSLAAAGDDPAGPVGLRLHRSQPGDVPAPDPQLIDGITIAVEAERAGA